MDVRWISPGVVEHHEIEDLKALLERDRGFVWVDIPECDAAAAEILSERFGFHSLAIKACRHRSHVPKIHAYPDHVFLVFHAPEPGAAGHIHLLELDLFVGPRSLVTVHGPLAEGVPRELALREANDLLERMSTDRFSPSSPIELAHALVAAVARRQEILVHDLATKIATLERRVLGGQGHDPEEELEEMFRIRHELLTVRTMAAQSGEVCARLVSLARFLPEEAQPFIEDLQDQFDRLRNLCDGEKEFLQGVVDFYQSKTTTKINIAMERLALIAALVLPVSLVAAIYGMNIIVPGRTDPLHIGGVLALMALMAFMMLRWAKRHGWW